MNAESNEKKDALDHKRDISSLYARLGLDAATYKEFGVAAEVRPSTDTSAAATQPEARVRVRSALESVPQATKPAGLPAPRQMRWPALKSLDIPGESTGSQRHKAGTRIALFSMSGGVGRTTLAVNLARALSARHRDVVLVNCGNSFGLDPYLRPKTPRFDVISFLHGTSGSHTPVTVIQGSAAELGSETNAGHASMFLEHAAERSDFVLYDMPVGLDGAAREILGSVDHIIVPLVPDLASAASVSLIDSLLQTRGRQAPAQISFLFNRFDESRQLHREIRARVERIVGPRLLRFAVRENADLQEAAIEGMAFVDHQPESPTTADLNNVAEWVACLDRDGVGSADMVRRGTA